MTQKSSVLSLVWRAASLVASLSDGFVAAPWNRPNIAFFLADDLGQRDIGVYGSTFYEKPNIDRLAREGARFTDGYAACAHGSRMNAGSKTVGNNNHA